MKSAEYSHGGSVTGRDIADRRPYTGWMAIRIPVNRHQSTHRLDYAIVGRTVSVGAGLTKSRNGAIDKPLIYFFQCVITETQSFHSARAKILHQNVSRRYHLQEYLFPFILFQI